jgi:hypothetical protein
MRRLLFLLALLLPVAASADSTITGPITFKSPDFTVAGSRVSIGGATQNFYVSTTGNDSAGCTQTAPCLTLAHVAGVIASKPTLAPSCVINLAAGTYSAGAQFIGPLPCAVTVSGAGSGSTTIADTESTICSPIQSIRGAYVLVTGLTIFTTCSGGSDLFAQQGGMIEIDSDVVLGAAPIAKVFAEDNSSIFLFGPLTSGVGLTISGNGQYGFLASENSTIRFFGGDDIIAIASTPIFSGALLDAINNSTIKPGSYQFSGGFSGMAYALAQNSSVDVDQSTSAVPGTQGAVASGGVYFQIGTVAQACTPPAGGGGSCSITTAPTGLGAGAAASIITGSGDYGGKVMMTAGAGASGSGVIFVAPFSKVNFCTASLDLSGTGAWDSRATVLSTYGNFSGSFGIELAWDNNAVPLTSASTYLINYLCR